jgi:hypothetical protein
MTNLPSHPLDCPPWEYEHHPRKKDVLPARVAEMLQDLAPGKVDAKAVALDTRTVHRLCFRELTPNSCEYYPGHYSTCYPC